MNTNSASKYIHVGEKDPERDKTPTYPKHLLRKLRECTHSWVRSNTYESEKQCGMCAISYDMHKAYEKDIAMGQSAFDDLEVKEDGEWVANPYSGERVWLEPLAVAVYDYTKGCEMFGDFDGVRLGTDWFIEHYPSEYMVLLD